MIKNVLLLKPKRILTILLTLVLLFVFSSSFAATTRGTTSSSFASDLNSNLQKQAELQNQIKSAQSQEKTLNDQLSVMNDQISLVNLQIEQTQNQISQLSGQITDTENKITTTEKDLTDKTKIANQRVKGLYEQGSNQTLELFLSSGGFDNFLILQKYNEAIHDQEVKLINSLKDTKEILLTEKTDLSNQQTSAQNLATQLDNQKNALTNQQNQKNSLLSITKNSEASYQSQLATAQAEEKTLLAFANARVGSGGSILPHVDLSDSWGKYYNQRDSYWGNIYIGGSDYTVWEVGCLITSVAMVYSHYGYNDMTPGLVAANSSNFWGSSAAMLIPGPVPPGHTATYVYNPTNDYISSQVSAGNPVIIGMDLGGGQTHWVVVRGLDSGGNFMINDPWNNKAMNIPLSLNYSGVYIFAARAYN